MEERRYIWDTDLTIKFFKLKFENDLLFRKMKQPWREFYKILLETGFPKEITVKQVARKWIATYNDYLDAKKKKRTNWIYYDIFEKFYGKSVTFDKYESWSDDWRLKLIYAISEAKDSDIDYQRMWKIVEKTLRELNLPNDCFIQDIKGLWGHLKATFSRKHRIQLKKGTGSSDWPLYHAMLEYFEKFDPECLVKMETDSYDSTQKDTSNSSNQISRKYRKEIGDEEFEWNQDNTATFIQIRLQNDSLFREKKCNWNDLLAVMIDEYKFPGTLTPRDLFKKWASIYYEHEKAKTMNDKTWVYYNLFEHYLGESSFNPIVDWQEEWVFNLISARTDLHPLFKGCTNQSLGWREVEKKLRNIDIPLDYSLLDIPEIWTYLLKTFRLKQKLENKGLLNEQWPYYDAMNYYLMLENASEVKVKRQKSDDEDDEKQTVTKKPKIERIDSKVCRSCSNEKGCLNIFEEKDAKGINLAYKLKVVGGVKVERTDNLPSLMCVKCAKELESAYKFRAKCQVADRRLRKDLNAIKEEAARDENDTTANEDYEEVDRDDTTDANLGSDVKQEKSGVKPKRQYVYRKICEICGKNVRNMYAHKDVHSVGKTYSCDVCGKRFKFRSGLMLHRDVHFKAPKKTCEYCGKTFHLMVNYKHHVAYHRNERQFECETCGKRFNTSRVLYTHKKSHSDERKYECDLCDKGFNTSTSLMAHKRSHSDEKAFSCHECGKSYKNPGGLAKHNKNIHRRIKDE